MGYPKVFWAKVHAKYPHLYGKLRVDHVKIYGKTISTQITLWYWQACIVWKQQW